MEEKLAIGKLGSSFGLEGFIKVQSFSGEWGHFLNLEKLELRKGGKSRSFPVADVRKKGGQIQIRLEGIHSPESAREFTGWESYVSRDNAAPLEEGEFFHADLCACRLIYNNRNMGTVKSVVEGGNGELLEVEVIGTGIRYVPFMGEYIGQIDLDKGTIELLQDGVLE